jgi:hypothetical protein
MRIEIETLQLLKTTIVGNDNRFCGSHNIYSTIVKTRNLFLSFISNFNKNGSKSSLRGGVHSIDVFAENSRKKVRRVALNGANSIEKFL